MPDMNRNDYDLDDAFSHSRFVLNQQFKEDLRARLRQASSDANNPAFASNGWRRPSQALYSRHIDEENKAMSNSRLIPAFAAGLVILLVVLLGGAIALPSLNLGGVTPEATTPPTATPKATGTPVATLKGDLIPESFLNITFVWHPRLLRLRAASDPICRNLGYTGNCYTIRNAYSPSREVAGPAAWIDDQIAIQVLPSDPSDVSAYRTELGDTLYFKPQSDNKGLTGAGCTTCDNTFFSEGGGEEWTAQPMPTPKQGERLVLDVGEIVGVWQIEGTGEYVQFNPDGSAIVSLTATKTDNGVRLDKESGESDYLLTAKFSVEDSQIRWADTGGTLYSSKKRIDAFMGLVGIYDLRLAENGSRKELIWTMTGDDSVIGRPAELTAGPWIYQGPIAP